MPSSHLRKAAFTTTKSSSIATALQWCSLWSIPAFLASIFFAISLTPSLLPRPIIIQGLLSGISLALGYGVGVLGVWLWRQLQLPSLPAIWQRRAGFGLALLSALIVASFLWKSSGWQNNVRDLMGMEPSAATSPLSLIVTAAVVAGLLLLLSRFFLRLVRKCSAFLRRFLPPRPANILGLALTFLLFWTIIDGLLVRSLLRAADRSFQQLDALIEADQDPPPQFSGDGQSSPLLSWQDLGRQGRLFVSSATTSDELSYFFGSPTPAPIRVYVGLNSAPTIEARADLALSELIRTDAFERSLLVIATPTGTGWIDPGAASTVEYLHRGDIATVAVQYSYLNSPLALLTQADYGAEMARALFATIYGHWRSLPRESRPRLFLHGLSLGSFHSDLSFSLFDIIDDPFDGALWSGPPFRNETWNMATARRNPDSPAWLPTFRDGTVVRFANQDGIPQHNSSWGNFRLVFLQHASDPITFFSPAMTWSEPAWMKHPRGPDVTSDLRWFPVVTSLQVIADMIVGTAPPGFGHEFAPLDYLLAWKTLTEPPDLTPDQWQRLQEHFSSPGT